MNQFHLYHVGKLDQIREREGQGSGVEGQTSERPLVGGRVGVEELGVYAGAVEVPCLQPICEHET